MPIVIHGYDYPVPDGRGYLGGFWVLPGPWLSPGFRKKGYDRTPDAGALRPHGPAHRPLQRAGRAGSPAAPGSSTCTTWTCAARCRSSSGRYRDWWNDELHPTEPGFRKVAATFDAMLQTLD